jgi:predicted Zn-dependent protease
MNRRKFLEYFGCSCCGLLLSQCGTVPITERRQLKIIPESTLNRQAAQIYEKVKSKEKLSDDLDQLNEIKEIGSRIEQAVSEYFYQNDMADPTANFNWEYILVENKKIKNAWCMPGGKIAVYSGILEVTKNKHGLAAVMGHEIAHAVAKHSVERASRSTLINVTTQIADIASGGKLSGVSRTAGVDVAGMLTHFGINNPFNRKQESEADYLGLVFSSLAGFDIRETAKIWERMKETNKGKEPPEWMSTHPSTSRRIKQINEWIPEIILTYPPITY